MRQYLTAQWPAPQHIKTAITTRKQGASCAPFDAFNLAMHVGDHSEQVLINRSLLAEDLALPGEPHWLEQTHSRSCIDLDSHPTDVAGDASFTTSKSRVWAIMSADCLPLLITNQAGTLVCAIHAGWRGLLAGIISKTITQLTHNFSELLVWLGPCIGPEAFTINADIRGQFIAKNSSFTPAFMKKGPRWHANLQQMATIELQQRGIQAIFCSPHCTFTQNDLFYSYRRNHITGRIASLIWIHS